MSLLNPEASIKIWSVDTQACLKTASSGYGLCSAFVPGNKHVIIGTKTGALELYELASASCIESVNAHENAIWALDIRPDKTGFVTGSADKSVKFWDFELVSEDKKVRRWEEMVMTH